ncbi:MAG: cobalamin biosynthesis protein CbiB [Burkholderiaceae bacterium]|jgi:adenosylcobinamide-phosphate synthase|nr:cobalamin biosynthesis protein CbiB [Burkholderiaceae bacterium]
MIIAAIIVAFLLDQIRPVGSGHVIAMSLRRWIGAVAGHVDAGGRLHAWLAWMLAVAVPALAAGLVGWLCTRAAGWLGQLAWAVVVLYFTLGFRQFSHHGTAIRDALAAGDEAKARTLLAQWQDEQAGYSDALPKGLAGRGWTWDSVARRAIAHAVLFAHRWVFGVLFWLCLLAPLGLAPFGAVLYRCAEFAARYWQRKMGQSEPVASPTLLTAAQTAWRVIDWLPARVTALLFAVVGNFEDAVAAWRQYQTDRAGGSVDPGNDAILLAAAAGALGIRLDDEAVAPGEAKPEPAAVPADSATPQADAATPAYPPDYEPAAASPDEAASASAADTPGLSGAEPDVRHFAQVAGLLWRSVALWLLLLVLLTLAHVLG